MQPLHSQRKGEGSGLGWPVLACPGPGFACSSFTPGGVGVLTGEGLLTVVVLVATRACVVLLLVTRVTALPPGCIFLLAGLATLADVATAGGLLAVDVAGASVL